MSKETEIHLSLSATAARNLATATVTVPQMTDWLRTAGAEGAISGTKFTQAILGMVRPLVPLAAKSKTAQAEILGLVQQADPGVKTMGELGKAGFTPDSIETTAVVTLDLHGDKPTVPKSHLTTKAKIPGIDKAKFDEIAAGAKAGCPISRLLAAAEITLDATLV